MLQQTLSGIVKYSKKAGHCSIKKHVLGIKNKLVGHGLLCLENVCLLQVGFGLFGFGWNQPIDQPPLARAEKHTFPVEKPKTHKHKRANYLSAALNQHPPPPPNPHPALPSIGCNWPSGRPSAAPSPGRAPRSGSSPLRRDPSPAGWTSRHNPWPWQQPQT